MLRQRSVFFCGTGYLFSAEDANLVVDAKSSPSLLLVDGVATLPFLLKFFSSDDCSPSFTVWPADISTITLSHTSSREYYYDDVRSSLAAMSSVQAHRLMLRFTH